ncbi:hypothetical protein AB1Y20_008975 [Prymnesium parvum]|uniref:phosphoribosylformylglycinamidine synthase n=1 Tax=Prymnesium parvum TaxID=97485 RepID=A0AB34K323_PRYPA
MTQPHAKRQKKTILQLYKQLDDPTPARRALAPSLSAAGVELTSLTQETCFNVSVEGGKLTAAEEKALHWLLAETFEPTRTRASSFLSGPGALLEVGPRLAFCTAWSTNAVSICAACGLEKIKRIERSRRYLVVTEPQLSAKELAAHAEALHDRMTECVYETPLTSFAVNDEAKPVVRVPLLKEGPDALKKLSDEMGFGFDQADLDYYTDIFVNKLKRDPTDVELFDIGQSNSEHSRHWYFGGTIVIDGTPQPQTLFKMVKATLKGKLCNDNSVIAFHDNSSSIKGYPIKTIRPSKVDTSSAFKTVEDTYHLILTAETHNFPCGVAPFPGAETGTGGRIRDVHATGRGAMVVAGISAYCMGNLQIPGYVLPWEDATAEYPDNLAPPLQIQIDASNGASDYGNKFGEPVIVGFNRSFGMRCPNGERREWIKPIMFSAGLGQISATHVKKFEPEVGMWVVKLGGPAYRIGLGGGAASSKAGGEGKGAAALDFNAVQRGDAEMENKMNRVIRACVELGDQNPIVSIHDQGAGGNGNVLKEIVDPLGGKFEIRAIHSGDETLSVLELWGAEYQENCALLLREEHREMFEAICRREQSPVSFVGRVSGDGRVLVVDEKEELPPVDLPLSLVLGDLPPKTFYSKAVAPLLKPLVLPEPMQVADALDRVLRLASVGSKRFLTNKVDRSVTGLIAQQQCVGPFHTPLADVGVIAQSHEGVTGAATAVGEQPIKGLLSPSAMARLAVSEALTNLVWAPISALGDVKCSANWMWAAKLEGEGAAMYEACSAMSSFMCEIGVSVDGGKDSLSMAARVGDETVKAPGALVITAYAACPDITLIVTPDLKSADGVLYLIDPSEGKRRLGGTSLAQVFGQLGDTPPDVESPEKLAAAFKAVQSLLRSRSLLAGHDVSDGGILVALLEMAFAGDRGLDLDLPVPAGADVMAALFAEEPSMVIEVAPANAAAVEAAFASAGVSCERVGTATGDKRVQVKAAGKVVLNAAMVDLRDAWEATGAELEKLQAKEECTKEEAAGLRARTPPVWQLSFAPKPTAALSASGGAPVAVLRQEGTNGDREMAAALYAAGLQPWDVTMTDLMEQRITLDRFRGVVFPGGFSYGDVLDSAKGWAAVLKYKKDLAAQLDAFYVRQDTFSLGVCNGCQLMALLGWVPGSGKAAKPFLDAAEQPRFVHNNSGRFESRFTSVTILPSSAVLLKGMEGSSMGVWVAHGEGKAHFPQPELKQQLIDKRMAPIRYVDDCNAVAESYPHNPNGSPDGIAALCSEDGRHLAMMPHPERCFLKWQYPWMPSSWDVHEASPWLKLFQNAASFCNGD